MAYCDDEGCSVYLSDCIYSNVHCDMVCERQIHPKLTQSRLQTPKQIHNTLPNSKQFSYVLKLSFSQKYYSRAYICANNTQVHTKSKYILFIKHELPFPELTSVCFCDTFYGVYSFCIQRTSHLCRYSLTCLSSGSCF